jgi:elongation factor 3
MPHQVSPQLLPMRTAKTTLPAHAAPAQEGENARGGEVAVLLHTIFEAKTSQESLDAAYALSDMVARSLGYHALEDCSILEAVRQAAADKRSGTRRESAMILLGALFERLPPAVPLTEVLFMRRRQQQQQQQQNGLVALALDALADKGGVVRESAQYALDALFANLRPEALVAGLLPVLLEYLERKAAKWQGTVAALQLLGKMADKAKIGMGSAEAEKGKEVLREAMGRKLAAIIPLVENGMHHLKTEVCCFLPPRPSFLSL